MGGMTGVTVPAIGQEGYESLTPPGFEVFTGMDVHGPEALAIIKVAGANTSAAVLTTPPQGAAPAVALTRQAVSSGSVRAVFLHKGNAGAMLGQDGDRDVGDLQRAAAQRVGVSTEQMAVMMTGAVGVRLPVEHISRQIAAVRSGNLEQVAHAILTVDRHPKGALWKFPNGARLVGIAKGAGMLRPRLVGPPQATMLVVLLTDALVPSSQLQAAIIHANNQTFNRLDGDGFTSTNDCLLALASGVTPDPLSQEQINHGVLQVSRSLADQLQRDAEASSKCIDIVVRSSLDTEPARIAAEHVAQKVLGYPLIAGGVENGRLDTGYWAAAVRSAVQDVPGGTFLFSIEPPCCLGRLFRPSCQLWHPQAVISHATGLVPVHWGPPLSQRRYQV